MRPGRKVAPGTTFAVGADLRLEVGERLDDGAGWSRSDTDDVLSRARPPRRGAAAALHPPRRSPIPSATRPSTPTGPARWPRPPPGSTSPPAVLDAHPRRRARRSTRVDLVVGLGTFRPITAEQVEDHVMHEERYDGAPAETWERVPARPTGSWPSARRRSGRSSRPAATGELAGRTGLFLTPGAPFTVVDVLLTNFHLPRSSLLVLVEAFAGPHWRDLYRSRAGGRATGSCPSATPCCSAATGRVSR